MGGKQGGVGKHDGDAAVVDALVAHQYVEARLGELLLAELEYTGGGGGGGGEGFEVYDVAEKGGSEYSKLTKTSTALARLAVTCVLSAARRLVLIFVNPL